jgi:long-chain acyl-CoA synthetase
MMKNILQVFDERVKNNGDKTLIILEEQQYSYATFHTLVIKIANKLIASDYKRGDRVALIIEEYDYFYASILAIWYAGGVVVPLNTSLSIKDLQLLIEKSGSTTLMSTEKTVDDYDIAQKLMVNDALDDAANASLCPLENDEMAAIMFTSGTTGIPKGVVQTMYTQSQNNFWTCEQLALGADDRIYINTPPYFTSGLSHFLTLIYAGGSLVGFKGFVFGKELLERMQAAKATGFGGAPAHLVRVVETLEAQYLKTDIRFWMSSGDHLPKSAIEKAREYMPNVKLVNVYGLTEVSGRLCILRPEFAVERHGSVGKPIGDMSVTVVGADNRPVAPNEIGEVNVSGSLLLKEYLDAPETTKNSIGDYGFKTGDFGYLDQDGFLYIEGRKDDIFKRGGEKVSTNKIKQALLQLELFKDVAVVAKDDEIMGKVPVACVVMKDDVKFSRFKIIKALRGNIVDTHIPANIYQLDEIPRTGSGKAIMKELKKIVNR